MNKSILTVFFLAVCFSPVRAEDNKLSTDDIKWLNRLTYGINTATLNAYQTQGKKQFLQTQLDPNAEATLPSEVSDFIAQSSDDHSSLKARVQTLQQDNKHVQSLPLAEKQIAVKELNKQTEQKVTELTQRHLLQALYSPAQVKEQMVWFWLNHFSVFKNKGRVIKLALVDYEEQAIRPHALGKFRHLLLATLRHPAMLLYLDNAQNAANKINENYARELMELHTLGVDGGYSQQDVQELSRILTGVGVNWTDKLPHLTKDLKPYYQSEGNGFEFNPVRHDFGKKVFLGETIDGQGFAEVERVLDKLVKHPATAHFISRKLATYFVSDTPSDQLIEQTAKTFQSTDGDIAKTLQTLLTSAEFEASLGKKVSDPLHYVLATMRFVYDEQTPTNMQPVMRWLNVLGEPLYGHLTPDGYGMTEKDWVSQGQLLNRFKLAKQMTSYNSKLFAEQDSGFSFSSLFEALSSTPAKKTTVPKLETPLFHQAIEPLLSEQTKAALNKANNAQEWNSLLLSSPEFLYR